MAAQKKPDTTRGEMAFIIAIVMGLLLGYFVKNIRIGIIIGIVFGLLILFTGMLRSKKR